MLQDIIAAIWPSWEVVEQLGQGSYGTVFKALRTDAKVQSTAAIKVITIPQDSAEVGSLRSEGLTDAEVKTYYQGIVDDFVSEISIMESFKGIQNIVSIEDYQVVQRQDKLGWDIVVRMELLTPFDKYLQEHPMGPEEVIQLGCDICTALEICGRKNIIHRDIKPENIFVNEFGFYKLGDFGIAKRLEGLSVSHSQKGTYNYMAPEVAMGTHYDARVDIYSLGIVLYRLLNENNLPFINEKNRFSAAGRKEALEKRLSGAALPAPVSAPEELAKVVLKACAFKPEDRYATAKLFKRDLEKVRLALPIVEENGATLYDTTVSVAAVGIAAAAASAAEKQAVDETVKLEEAGNAAAADETVSLANAADKAGKIAEETVKLQDEKAGEAAAYARENVEREASEKAAEENAARIASTRAAEEKARQEAEQKRRAAEEAKEAARIAAEAAALEAAKYAGKPYEKTAKLSSDKRHSVQDAGEKTENLKSVSKANKGAEAKFSAKGGADKTTVLGQASKAAKKEEKSSAKDEADKTSALKPTGSGQKTDNNPPKPADEEEKKKKPLLWIIIGAVAAIVIIILLLLKSCGGDPGNGEHKHSLEYFEAVPASCASAGHTAYYQCKECKLIFADDKAKQEVQPAVVEIAATGHHAVADAAVEASCSKAGLTAGSHCADCGTVLTAQEEIPKLEHHEVVQGAVAASVDSEGYSGDIYCELCGLKLEAGKIIAKLDHVHEMVKTAAKMVTCTEDGNIEFFKCGICGKYYNDAIGTIEYTVDMVIQKALEHNIVKDEGYPATCTTNGVTEGAHCSHCNLVIVQQQVIPATGHKEVKDAAVAATCTTAGKTEGIHCSVCNEVLVEQKTVAALGHTEEVRNAVAATESKEGYSGDTYCAVCGQMLADGHTVARLDHVHTMTKTAAVEPTCTKTGNPEYYTCSKCGKYYRDTQGSVEYRKDQLMLAAKGHTEVADSAVAATCTATGLTAGSHCSVCGQVIVAQNTVEKAEHTPIKDMPVAATCTTPGLTEGSHCGVCNTVIVARTTVPAAGHTAQKIAAIQPGCTASGMSEGSRCSVCNEVLKAQEPVPAKGHTIVKDAAVAATCTASGLTEGSHCSVCQTVLQKQQTVPAKGHTEEVRNAVAATEERAGYSGDTYCAVCGMKLASGTTIAKLNHTHNMQRTAAVAATCTTAGNPEYYTCTKCGKYYNDAKGSVEYSATKIVTPALGHTVVTDAAVAATCTSTGLTEGSHCGVCGTVIQEQTTVAALGHNWDNGTEVNSFIRKYTCNRCGATENRSTVSVGSQITMGNYGGEAVTWRVLAVESGRALIISEYVLDALHYHSSITEVTWETCTLRSWLNSTFINSCFNTTEQERILTTTVVKNNNPSYGTSGGNNTQDKIFLLSTQEVERYFSSDADRRCGTTDYAKAQGADTNPYYSSGGKATCGWWLRSPGSDSEYIVWVGGNGIVYYATHTLTQITERYGVRPALWINLES